jgi:hypothetical protein
MTVHIDKQVRVRKSERFEFTKPPKKDRSITGALENLNLAAFEAVEACELPAALHFKRSTPEIVKYHATKNCRFNTSRIYGTPR